MEKKILYQKVEDQNYPHITEKKRDILFKPRSRLVTYYR